MFRLSFYSWVNTKYLPTPNHLFTKTHLNAKPNGKIGPTNFKIIPLALFIKLFYLLKCA